METAEAIIEEAAKLLAGSGLVPIPFVILAVIGIAVLLAVSPSIGRAVWKAIKSIKIEPAPQPISDGGQASDRDQPPAQQGNVPPATDAPGDSG